MASGHDPGGQPYAANGHGYQQSQMQHYQQYQQDNYDATAGGRGGGGVYAYQHGDGGQGGGGPVGGRQQGEMQQHHQHREYAQGGGYQQQGMTQQQGHYGQQQYQEAPYQQQRYQQQPYQHGRGQHSRGAHHAQDGDLKTLRIAGFELDWQSDYVELIFRDFGIAAMKLPTDDYDGSRNKGFAYIEFTTRASAEAVLRQYDRTPVDHSPNGHTYTVSWAKYNISRGGSGGGSMGGGGGRGYDQRGRQGGGGRTPQASNPQAFLADLQNEDGSLKDVFVGNLPVEWNERMLADNLLSSYQSVDKVSVVPDQRYGFVHFTSPDEAMRAFSEIGGATITSPQGQPLTLRVHASRSRSQFNRGGGGMGGGGYSGGGGGRSTFAESSTLFLPRLPMGVDQAWLREAFSRYGAVLDVRILQRGGAFLDMESVDVARECVAALNGWDVQGFRLKVLYGKARDDSRRGSHFEQGGPPQGQHRHQSGPAHGQQHGHLQVPHAPTDVSTTNGVAHHGTAPTTAGREQQDRLHMSSVAASSAGPTAPSATDGGGKVDVLGQGPSLLSGVDAAHLFVEAVV